MNEFDIENRKSSALNTNKMRKAKIQKNTHTKSIIFQVIYHVKNGKVKKVDSFEVRGGVKNEKYVSYSRSPSSASITRKYKEHTGHIHCR